MGIVFDIETKDVVFKKDDTEKGYKYFFSEFKRISYEMQATKTIQTLKLRNIKRPLQGSS